MIEMEIPDDLKKPVKLLIQEYDKAKDLYYVRDPVCYAMFHAWQNMDRKVERKL